MGLSKKRLQNLGAELVPRIRMVKARKYRATPRVGIIYFVRGKLFIDSTPLAQAGSGDSNIHERDHISYSAELVESGRVPNAEYE